MSKIQKILVYGGLILLAVILGIVYFGQKTVEVKTIVEKQIGAVPGPDILSDYINLNGVELWPSSQTAKKATTTICAFKSPNSTSTLSFASVDLRVGTTVESIIDIARATTAFATTTKIGSTYTLAASTGVTIVASTSPLSASDGATIIFPPNNYLVVKMVGAGGGNNVSPTGTCKAIFTKN